MDTQIHKRLEISLEDFMINCFGKTLYEMSFEDYTEKLWGRHLFCRMTFLLPVSTGTI